MEGEKRIKMKQGYIKLNRSFMENRAYFAEPFCRNMAWIDMLMLANHAEGDFFCRGIEVRVNRGQIGYGLEALAARWKWSRGKVERYFRLLEKNGQIIRQKSNVTTLITIVNYNKYQGDDKANNKANDKADRQQTDINKNDKNNKKEYTPDFLAWWTLYDKHQGKQKAAKLWTGLAQDERNLIMIHTPKYVLSTPIKQYRKDPCTYLKNRAWEDEVIGTVAPTQNFPKKKEGNTW